MARARAVVLSGVALLTLAAALAGTPLVTPAAAARDVATGEGAALRALDTVSGLVQDLTLTAGQSRDFGGLRISLGECRYPAENIATDAYARLTIVDRVQSTKVFDGWMIASSPGLSALDHPRYDVWVLRCITSSTATDGG